MKSDGLLACNWLKGSEGDAIHAVMWGVRHKLRPILAHLRVLLLTLIGLVMIGRINDASTRRH